MMMMIRMMTVILTQQSLLAGFAAYFGVSHRDEKDESEDEEERVIFSFQAMHLLRIMILMGMPMMTRTLVRMTMLLVVRMGMRRRVMFLLSRTGICSLLSSAYCC